MIWESSYWKSDLIKDADILKRWAIKKASIKQEVLFEKKIMLSAYAIRKLIEAEKIGPDIKCWNITIKKFPVKDSNKQPDLMNWHRIDELYDIETAESSEQIDLKYLCNLIIHSFIFCLTQGNDAFIDGFFVTSDLKKNDYLYWINLADFINSMIGVGNSDVRELIMFRNNKKTTGWTVNRKYTYK